MREVGTTTVLGLLIERLKKSKLLSEIVIATTRGPEDDNLAEFALSNNVQLYRGPTNDVLGRYFEAATLFRADYVVRITGDCPLVDSSLVDQAIKLLRENDLDYVSNTNPPTFPDGFDVEVFSYSIFD
jgi:spore coat polysaccharide biosynthesis protein SpsF (cytidylyltransferase family)